MARLRKTDKTRALKRVGLFADLSQRELGFLASQVTELTFPEDTVLVAQGERGREAMVLMSGTAVVRRNKRKIAELGPGDVLGEMSLINQAPRNATVTATSPVTALVMDAREFSSVVEANPSIAVKVLKTVAARLVENQAFAV